MWRLPEIIVCRDLVPELCQAVLELNIKIIETPAGDMPGHLIPKGTDLLGISGGDIGALQTHAEPRPAIVERTLSAAYHPPRVSSPRARRDPGAADSVPEPAGDDLAGALADRIVVAEALADLPAAQRDVIVLIDLIGFPAERAGARLGIGVRATRSRLHRARRALAASIASSRRRSA